MSWKGIVKVLYDTFLQNINGSLSKIKGPDGISRSAECERKQHVLREQAFRLYSEWGIALSFLYHCLLPPCLGLGVGVIFRRDPGITTPPHHSIRG